MMNCKYTKFIEDVLDLSFFLNVPQEEAFHLTIDYLKGRRLKILSSSSPSYIKAEFGSWASVSFDNSKGKVEINVAKRNGGSIANLNFDFSFEYLAALMVTIISALIIYIIYTILEIPLGFALSVIFVMVAIVVGVIGYSVSQTRRRFIEEFNMFIQSLVSKED